MQMSLRRNVIYGLLSVYGFANRRGLLDNRLAREAFARSYFLYKRAVEDPFAALLRKRPELFRGGHVLDVGANIGYTAAVFASGLSPGCRVYAFEPEAKNHAQLQRSIARLHLADRVEAVQAAVGAKDGVIELFRNDEHHGDHRIATDSLKAQGPNMTMHTVPLVSLDRFTKDLGPVRFVKIDVQGYETEVLAGMTRLMKEPQLVVAVEYMPEAMTALGFEAERMLDVLTSNGFQLNVLRSDGELGPFDRSNPEKHTQEVGYVDLLCMRSSA